VIGIPFYLAHPVLIKLERKMMLEAEGESLQWCMQLLRHEAGHALTYAFRINEDSQWRKVFGSPDQDYGDTYKFKPYSKNYVRHLDGFYAQYHPDEDFVETFAVWLTPDSDWRQAYKGWRAMRKLEYVDGLMESLKGKVPLKTKGRKLWDQSKSRLTLAKYYGKKRQLLKEEFPDFHDVHLNKIFASLSQEEYWAFCRDKRKNKNLMTADELIGQQMKILLNAVDRLSGERKYIISELIRTIRLRCQQLRMVVTQPKDQVLIQLGVYVTSLVMNYVHTGWFRGHNRHPMAQGGMDHEEKIKSFDVIL
jgi:RNase P/RNase MRP subunit p29